MVDQVYTFNQLIHFAAIFFIVVSVVSLWLSKRSMRQSDSAEENGNFMLERGELILKEKFEELTQDLAEEKKEHKTLQQKHQAALRELTKFKKGSVSSPPIEESGDLPLKNNESTHAALRNAQPSQKKEKSKTLKRESQIVDKKKGDGVSVPIGKRQFLQLEKILASGPKGSVDIVSIMDDENSYFLAERLNDILLKNGWNTNGILQRYFSSPPYGILISVHSRETAPSYTGFLQKTFENIGIKTSGLMNRKMREWSVTLIIGSIASE